MAEIANNSGPGANIENEKTKKAASRPARITKMRIEALEKMGFNWSVAGNPVTSKYGQIDSTLEKNDARVPLNEDGGISEHCDISNAYRGRDDSRNLYTKPMTGIKIEDIEIAPSRIATGAVNAKPVKELLLSSTLQLDGTDTECKEPTKLSKNETKRKDFENKENAIDNPSAKRIHSLQTIPKETDKERGETASSDDKMLFPSQVISKDEQQEI